MEDKNLKVIEFILKDEEKDKEIGSLDLISIVQDPAIETNFQLFNKGKKAEVKFSEAKERMEITGAAMRANKKILRIDEETGEYYYCFWSEKTVRDAAQLFFKHKNNLKTNIGHSGLEIKGDLFVYESWIVVDPKVDKATAMGFSDVQKGDWFVTFKITNESLWSFLKTYYAKGGFSVEGMFSFHQNAFNKRELSENELFDMVTSILEDENIEENDKFLKIERLLNTDNQ